MKNIVLAFAVALALLTSFEGRACDKGCTMGGSYVGILPQFNNHFVGIRYNTRSFTTSGTHTHMEAGMPHTHAITTEEQFSTLEAWGRFYPTRRIQVFALVPYVINSQKSSNGSSLYQQGLGDISLMANYSLLNTGDSSSHSIKHSLQLGGGVKLPTGAYKARHNNEVLAANLQAGTGSVDVMVNALYTIRYKQTGLSTDFTYRFNGKGMDDYRFGDRYNASANLFYWYKAGVVSLLPSAGLYAEKSRPGEQEHQHQHGTTAAASGSEGAYFANMGLSIYYKKFALGATYQVPLAQHGSHHATEANNRSQLSLSWMF